MMLTRDNLNSALLDVFPHLKGEKYADRIGGFVDWDPGPYILFGSVFNQYMRDHIRIDENECIRIADFLERMSISENAFIGDLLRIEVLPDLLKSQDSVDFYWPLLGKKTRWLLWLIAPKLAPDINIPSTDGR